MGRAGKTAVFPLVVLAVVAAGLSSCASHDAAARVDSTLSGVVGPRWRIAEVRHAVTITIPADRGGYFTLAADAALVADDTVNTYDARVRTTATGWYVIASSGTAAGYAGRDPIVLALIEGTQALTAEGASITARLVGSQLDLTVGGYRIMAVQAASVGTQPPLSPSPTNTRS